MTTELTTFQKNATDDLGYSGFTVDPKAGLTISRQNPDFKGAGAVLMSMSQSNKQQRKLIDWYIGQLIVNHSAVHDCSWSESISVLDLVRDTGREFKSIIKLPRMVTMFPDEIFNLPITSGHLEAASSFGGPKQVDDAREFNLGRLDLLRRCAEDPEERNRTWLTEKMRELQAEYKVQHDRQTPIAELRKAYEVVSQAVVEWNDEDYDTFGVTRGELMDRWQGYRDELVERGLLSDNSTDPISFSLPWRTGYDKAGQVIEAEVVDRQEDDETTEADVAV